MPSPSDNVEDMPMNEGWKTTKLFEETRQAIDSRKLLMLYGLPATGKTTLIEELNFSKFAESKEDPSNDKLYIDLAGIDAADRLRAVERIINKKSNQNFQIIVRADFFDIVEQSEDLRLQKKGIKNIFSWTEKRTKIIKKKIEDWKGLIPDTRLLFLSREDAEKLLNQHLEVNGLRKEIDSLNGQQAIEIKETLLKYSRISRDDVPELNFPKGGGFFFFQDVKEAIDKIFTDTKKVNLKKYGELKRDAESQIMAEKVFLTNPIISPALALISFDDAFAEEAGHYIVGLLRQLFNKFHGNQEIIGKVIEAIIPQVPAIGLSILLICLSKKKEHKNDFTKAVLELSQYWTKLGQTKKEAIGELYDAALGLERGLTKRTFDALSGADAAELKKRLPSIESFIIEAEEHFREIDEWAISTDTRIVDLEAYSKQVRSFVPMVSYLYEDWPVEDDRLRDLLGELQSKEKIVDLWNSEEKVKSNLFLYGTSGSGKTTLAYQIIKRRRETEKSDSVQEHVKGVWFIGFYRECGPEKPLDQLLSEIRDHSCKGQQLIVWDNFPTGLSISDNIDQSVRAYEILSSYLASRYINCIMTLKPKLLNEHAKFQPLNFKKVQITYNELQLRDILLNLANEYLDDRRTELLIDAIDDISFLLFKQWNTPKAIKTYLDVLNRNNVDTIEEMKRCTNEVTEKRYTDYVRLQLLKNNDGSEEDLRIDFLYALKIAILFGLKRDTEEAINDVQTIFLGTRFIPDAQACVRRFNNIWYYKENKQQYSMHDLDAECLDDDQTLSIIFEHIENLGFDRLIRHTYSDGTSPNIDPDDIADFLVINLERFKLTKAEALLTQDYLSTSAGRAFGKVFNKIRKKDQPSIERLCECEGFAVGLGLGIGFSFNSMGIEEKNWIQNRAMIDIPFASNLGGIIGERKCKLSNEEKKWIQELTIKSWAFAHCLGQGLGRRYHDLSDEEREWTIEMLHMHFKRFDYKTPDFGVGLGVGIARMFNDLTEVEREWTRNCAAENGEFAHGLGLGLAGSYRRLNDLQKEWVRSLVPENESFSEQFGATLGESVDSMNDEEKGWARELTEENNAFATGFGKGVAKQYKSLAVEEKRWILDLGRSVVFFSAGLGIQIGESFKGLSNSERDELQNIILHNPDIGAGFSIGVSRLLNDLNENERSWIWNMAMSDDHFAEFLGKALGLSYPTLNEGGRDWTRELILKNDHVAIDWGLGFFDSSKNMSYEDKEWIRSLARESAGFSIYFGKILGSKFSELSWSDRQWLRLLADENNNFAGNVGGGFADILGKLDKTDFEQVLSLAIWSPSIANGLSQILGGDFTIQDEIGKKRVLDLARNVESFAIYFGIDIMLSFRNFNDDDRKMIWELTLENPIFAGQFGINVAKKYKVLKKPEKEWVGNLAAECEDFDIGLYNGLSQL